MDDEELKAKLRQLGLTKPDETVLALRRAGLEQLAAQGRWKGLDAVLWDATGECLVVRYRCARPGKPDYHLNWEIPAIHAEALLLELQRVFLERGSAAPPMQ